mmetsp:Transcript_21442/g.68486  ORF Transcript_21442/g.68486 Transcript_21442/m.68486 type:complete len:316 (+) Transcript_21442:712-1659(+)
MVRAAAGDRRAGDPRPRARVGGAAGARRDWSHAAAEQVHRRGHVPRAEAAAAGARRARAADPRAARWHQGDQAQRVGGAVRRADRASARRGARADAAAGEAALPPLGPLHVHADARRRRHARRLHLRVPHAAHSQDCDDGASDGQPAPLAASLPPARAAIAARGLPLLRPHGVLPAAARVHPSSRQRLGRSGSRLPRRNAAVAVRRRVRQWRWQWWRRQWWRFQWRRRQWWRWRRRRRRVRAARRQPLGNGRPAGWRRRRGGERQVKLACRAAWGHAVLAWVCPAARRHRLRRADALPALCDGARQHPLWQSVRR